MVDVNYVHNDPNRCTMYIVGGYKNFGGAVNFNIGYFYFYDDSVAFISSYLGMVQSIVRLVLISGLEYNNDKTNCNDNIYVYLKSMNDFDKLISIVQMCVTNKVQIEGKELIEEFFNDEKYV